jgi:phosphate:Na+ symporter
MSNIYIILGIIFSVGLFLYSVISFGNVIKSIAGQKIKTLLSSLTSNPIKGFVLGTVSTVILQSGTAASVIVANLADAGLISFYNTLGVLFGLNIGASITSQLIAFNFMFISPFIILLGLIICWWGGRLKKYGKPVFYFGLLFFSIYLISMFFSYADKDIISNYLSITSKPLIAILIGIVATIVFQSSSVVTGIVLVLVGSGHIDIVQAIGLVLGANIGTTSTVIIASLSLNKEAKKVALSHFLFNFLGVIILIPFLDYFYNIVQYLGGSTANKVANIYLLFNIICVSIFMILIKPFYKLINLIIR